MATIFKKGDRVRIKKAAKRIPRSISGIGKIIAIVPNPKAPREKHPVVRFLNSFNYPLRCPPEYLKKVR